VISKTLKKTLFPTIFLNILKTRLCRFDMIITYFTNYSQKIITLDKSENIFESVTKYLRINDKRNKNINLI
jgi:hypothetical protein